MEQDIEILLQIWKALKPHLLGGDSAAAAEDFVHVLMEHGIDANEIMTFAIDNDLKSILRAYADEEHFDEEDDDEHFDDDDDENLRWN